MNNKVNFLRGTSTEYAASTKDNDTFYYTTDTKKLYLGGTEITGIEIDDTSTSETDKTWSAKKISDSIPTKLPANGGNADTVDGKHASDFMQNLGTLTTGSLLDYVLTMTNSGYLLVNSNVTDTPVSGQFFFVDVRRDAGGSYAITATRFNAGGVYTNRYNAGAKKWYGWANVADGGNADTLDSKHAIDFSQIISFGDTPTDTKTAIGIPFKTTTYWCSHWTDYPSDLPDGQGTILAINYKGSGTAGSDYIWTTQIYISATSSFTNPRIYFRTTKKDSVNAWRDIADGGNAATVGGHSITVTDVDPGAGSALGTGEIVFVTEVT